MQSASIRYVCQSMSRSEAANSSTINRLLLVGAVYKRVESPQMCYSSYRSPFLITMSVKSNTKNKENYFRKTNLATRLFVLASWKAVKTVVKAILEVHWCNQFLTRIPEFINTTKLVLSHMESVAHEQTHLAFTPAFSTSLTGFKRKSDSKFYRDNQWI